MEDIERLTSSTKSDLEDILAEAEELKSNAEEEYTETEELVSEIRKALELIDELGNLEQIEEDIIRQKNNGVKQPQSDQTLQKRYDKSLEEISQHVLKIKIVTDHVKHLYKDLHPDVEENEDILEHMKNEDLEIAENIENIESLEEEVQELEGYHNDGQRSISV